MSPALDPEFLSYKYLTLRNLHSFSELELYQTGPYIYRTMAPPLACAFNRHGKSCIDASDCVVGVGREMKTGSDLITKKKMMKSLCTWAFWVRRERDINFSVLYHPNYSGEAKQN